jgi:hypothetical protein
MIDKWNLIELDTVTIDDARWEFGTRHFQSGRRTGQQ